jgi:hypothetical protein
MFGAVDSKRAGLKLETYDLDNQTVAAYSKATPPSFALLLIPKLQSFPNLFLKLLAIACSKGHGMRAQEPKTE